jgi:hypothetical protein
MNWLWGASPCVRNYWFQVSSFPLQRRGFNGTARIIWLLGMSFRGANRFTSSVKLSGDEESHHYECEILLTRELLFRASPCVRYCWFQVSSCLRPGRKGFNGLASIICRWRNERISALCHSEEPSGFLSPMVSGYEITKFQGSRVRNSFPGKFVNLCH